LYQLLSIFSGSRKFWEGWSQHSRKNSTKTRDS
jgi:hypothetical protein